MPPARGADTHRLRSIVRGSDDQWRSRDHNQWPGHYWTTHRNDYTAAKHRGTHAKTGSKRKATKNTRIKHYFNSFQLRLSDWH
ncbi:hypothetical protein OKW46_000886 [Paraburkholderia sp. WSM4179]|nr:hypothetical protein [Paraburkholderia sp. WSM4179]